MAFKKNPFTGTMVLMDAMNCMFRTHHTNPGLTDQQGRPTSALHGMPMHIRKVRNKFKGAEITLLWDALPNAEGAAGKGWRFKYAPDMYKAQRETSEHGSIVHAQVKAVGRLLKYGGFRQLRLPSMEADDLIAVYADHLKLLGYRVIIDSTDKDFFQLLDDHTFVLKNEQGRLLLKEWAHIYGKYGVDRESWVTYRALVGDASDGMPGLKGCGPKTAPAYIAAGVDMEKPLEAQPEAVRKKATPATWKIAQACYHLSVLPNWADLGPLADRADELRMIVNYPEPPKRPDDFITLAKKYDLRAVAQDMYSIIGL